MINFDTSELKSRRKISIDGQTFVVRKMGNIENLEYSRLVRKLKEISASAGKRKLTKKESGEVDSISNRLGEMTIGLFDDGGDQSKSRKLVSSLNEYEISELLAMAFTEKENVKTHGDKKA